MTALARHFNRRVYDCRWLLASCTGVTALLTLLLPGIMFKPSSSKSMSVRSVEGIIQRLLVQHVAVNRGEIDARNALIAGFYLSGK
jgi:hypothetical protein